MIKPLTYLTIVEHTRSGEYLHIDKDKVNTLKELCKFAGIELPPYKVIKYQVVMQGLSGNNGQQYLVKKNGKLFASGISHRISLLDTYLYKDEIPEEYLKFARPVIF